MSLPTPPRYVVLPAEVIEQAFVPDKPRRALLASFIRILSLAWEAKYQQTPPLPEDELIEFLKLSRRQYFDQKADMELLGWLRSSHPRPGFVQFSFSRPGNEKAISLTSAENRTASAENPVVVGEESLNPDPIPDSPPPPVPASAENRTSPSVVEILRHTDLLFDGALVMSRDLADRDPLHALAWCAYAYSNHQKLRAPGGIVRNRLKDNEPPPEWARQQWRNVLPEDFLEALGLGQYTCALCQATFQTRGELDAHEATHLEVWVCPECGAEFESEDDLELHKEAKSRVDDSVSLPICGSLTPAQAWQSVLGQLQMDMPRASFDTLVRDSRACGYHDNILRVGVQNDSTREWLESRVASTASRLLVGILNASVSLEFVVMQS
ncbi:MAG: C2H2-type zinc finger protein [Anaerolineales bacterium]